MPHTIQCSSKHESLDFSTRYLPDLQSLRKGRSAINMVLILSAFQLREPQFATPAIQHLISRYRNYQADSPVFSLDSSHRSKRGLKSQNSNTFPATNNSEQYQPRQKHSQNHRQPKRRKMDSAARFPSTNTFSASSSVPSFLRQTNRSSSHINASILYPSSNISLRTDFPIIPRTRQRNRRKHKYRVKSSPSHQSDHSLHYLQFSSVLSFSSFQFQTTN